MDIDVTNRSKAFGAGAVHGYDDNQLKKLQEDSVSFNGASTLFPGGVCAQPPEQ